MYSLVDMRAQMALSVFAVRRESFILKKCSAIAGALARDVLMRGEAVRRVIEGSIAAFREEGDGPDD